MRIDILDIYLPTLPSYIHNVIIVRFDVCVNLSPTFGAIM